MQRFRTLAVVVVLVAGAAVLWDRLSPGRQWHRSPMRQLDVVILDYTVPFDTYKEHLGMIWLLNHLRFRAPDDAPQWRAEEHYIGYRPNDRPHPDRLAGIELKEIDLVYIADTYGVYRDDLRGIKEKKAHMDFNPLVFGALSSGDATALHQVVEQGGTVVAEFNTFCEPTSSTARARAERLFAVTWTGWVARVFQDPNNEDDVPHWLPREFAKQYPNEPYPREPFLLLVDRVGRLHLFSAPTVSRITPRVMMTPAGRSRFLGVPADTPYYYWFALVKAQEGTDVYARMRFPDRADLTTLLQKIGAGLEPPVLTSTQSGRAIYIAGDFADTDFALGDYNSVGIISKRAFFAEQISGITSAPVFWLFFAPVMQRILLDAVDE